MNRGDIWMADIGGKAGKRPVLVLTRSAAIPFLSSIVVVEITTQAKGYPTQVSIGQNGNLNKISYVSADALHNINKKRCLRFIGELPDDLMAKASRAVIFALDLGGATLSSDHAA